VCAGIPCGGSARDENWDIILNLKKKLIKERSVTVKEWRATLKNLNRTRGEDTEYYRPPKNLG